MCTLLAVACSPSVSEPPPAERPVAATPPPVCGDGRVEGDEACDDGNDLPNDGCSRSCRAPQRVDVASVADPMSVLLRRVGSPGDLDGDGLADLVGTGPGVIQLMRTATPGRVLRPSADANASAVTLSRGQGGLIEPDRPALVVGLPASRPGRGGVQIFSFLDGRVDSHVIRFAGQPQFLGLPSIDHGMDLDGDGLPDLIVGAESWRTGTDLTEPAGAVALVVQPDRTDFDPWAILVGSREEGLIGRHARLVSDADGDGRAEVLIARHEQDRGPVWISDPTPGEQPAHEAGATLRETAWFVDGHCDLNDDGYADLVTAAQDLHVYLGGARGFEDGQGSVAQIDIADGDTVLGALDVICLPDADGDARSEVAVALNVSVPGERNTSGEVVLLHGPISGRNRIEQAPLTYVQDNTRGSQRQAISLFALAHTADAPELGFYGIEGAYTVPILADGWSP